MAATWTNCKDGMPVPMQPVWVANEAHREDLSLAIYYGPQKGFVLVDDENGDALNGLDVTHWAGVRGPGAVPKRKRTSASDVTARQAGTQ